MYCSTILIYFVLLLIAYNVNGGLREGDCEVCISYLGRLLQLIQEQELTTEVDILQLIKEECNKATDRENRFCYYIGGTQDAATGMLPEITKPLSYSLPPEKICEKLKKKDSQICELRYEKKIDVKNVDLNKLRVRDLRKILSDWGEECQGCVEKSEFVKRIEMLMPKHEEL